MVTLTRPTKAEESTPAVRAAPRFAVCFQRVARRGGGLLADADARRPRQMRRVLLAHLRLWRLAHVRDTADLVVTELLTNALPHGRGEAVEVRVRATDTHLHLDVIDHVREAGGPPGTLPHVTSAAPLDESGRGLALVAALTDELEFSADGTRVWCTIALSRSRP